MNYQMKKINKHVPVLLSETLKNLNLKDNGVYVDATLGMGGYTRKILDNSNCTLIGIDRDPFAIKEALPLVKKYGVRLKLINGLFSNLEEILDKLHIKKINGITFDFGVSSPQIENYKRGFSFRYDGPLDMRMGQNNFSASDFININDQITIENTLRIYGEEKKARQISRAIVSARPIKTTKQLAEIIYTILGTPKKNKINPATKTFQAIRIAVNNELEEIKTALNASLKLLAPRGRILAVSFHSLEDRIVKRFFHENSNLKENSNRHQPPSFNSLPKLKIITKKPILPSDRELNNNIRSRSAKLRIAEKLPERKKNISEAA